MLNTNFKCNKNLKESLTPTRYPNPNKNSRLVVTNLTVAKIGWYLTELLNARSQVNYITLKVR